MKVYITKYAPTQGIREAGVDPPTRVDVNKIRALQKQITKPADMTFE